MGAPDDRSLKTNPEAVRRVRDGGARPEPGMLVTERVRLVRPLESGGMGAVWVAEHIILGTEVAVKFVRAADDAVMRERLSREAKLAARMTHPHAVRIFDHGLTLEGTPFIVMELLEGETLADRIERDGAIGLRDVRRLVSQVASVLAEAHGLEIAHRDIKPHNIVLLSATEELFAKVLDFGIAKPFEENVDSALTAEGEVVGTPVYMAPEQLVDGLAADARSDLWGLSVVAYQALTGHRPFRGRTRAAIGAAMLLSRYAAPSSLDPTTPGALDAWFASAFSVASSDRFGSAKELARTFEVAASGAPAGPGKTSDGSGRLRIPDKLYGRDAELKTLMNAFDLAASGRSRLALIAGYSGIGKTSLVAETEAPLAKRGATFVGGKFDQFDRGTPYASLVQAFDELVRQMLGGDDREVWKERVASGVRENLRALTDVIPQLENLVGPQPALEEASPSEARNRFQNAIARFVATIASSDRPLVVFLDDLQWADLPSLDLITSLCANPESRHVLWIGAYRDNEVGDGHPLRSTIARVTDAGGAIDTIELGPLGEDAVLDLVTDATDGAPGRVRLAVACHAKTRGNAFFLKRFLESLTEADLLRFDPDGGAWKWDLTAIQAIPMAESVVDFIADEMQRMPDAARAALVAAACIGARFDLAPLACALGTDRGTAFESLRQALASELVLPQTEGTWLTGPIDNQTDRMRFRFAHDRIRQAARSLLSEEDAARIHRAVGRFMLDHLDPSEREQRLFEVVEHLNRGTDEDLESTGSMRLRDLNLSAARRALASAAFEPAHGYYKEAHARLPEGAWEVEYEQTLTIHIEGARAAYLSGDHQTMTMLVESAVEHSRSLLERVSAQEVHMQALVSQQRFGEALALARLMLEELGFPVPAEPTDDDVKAAVGGTLGAVQEKGAEAIVSLPPCGDPRVVTAIRIQQGAMSSAYLVAPTLLPILCCNIVRATIEHGVCKESPYGFSVFALVLNAANLIDVAKGIGEVALGLLDRVDDRSVRPSTLHVLAAYVTAWTHHIRRSVEEERHVFQIAMDVGDLEYASWAIHVSLLNGFYGGFALAQLGEHCERDNAILRYHQQLPSLSCSLPVEYAVRRLTAADASDSEGAVAALEKQLTELKGVGFRGGVCVTAAVGAFLHLLFRDIDAATEWAGTGLEYYDGAVATYNGPFLHLTSALARLARVGPDSEDVGELVSSVGPHLEQLRIWCAASDVNHAHRVALLEAEVARVEGRTGEAMELYDVAIAHAREHGFLHEEALGNELAARFHLARGGATAARAYAREALEAYERWGASAKRAHLEAELDTLLA